MGSNPPNVWLSGSGIGMKICIFNTFLVILICGPHLEDNCFAVLLGLCCIYHNPSILLKGEPDPVVLGWIPRFYFSNKFPLRAVWLCGSAQNTVFLFFFFLRGRGPPPSSISGVAKLVCTLESHSNLQSILVPTSHVSLCLVWGTAWPWEF